MAEIEITVGSEDEQEKDKFVFKLNARKTLDGNLVIRDHPDIDIVIVASKRKVVAFPKESMSDEVYQTQDKLFDFLGKKGVIEPDSVQGGNVFGSMEAKIPETDDIDSFKIVTVVLAKFIEEERPFFEYLEKFEDMQDKWFTSPDEENSSEFDPSRHHETKGSIRPMYIRSPYGINYIYRG